MSYRVSTATYPITPQLPQSLGHKPVYAMPYQQFDGIHAANTDARYLSVGIAQYDPSHVSVKVMRFTGEQWSPQSEELPLHRIVDMTLFLAKALFDSQNNTLSLPGGMFLNQDNCIFITQEPRTPSEQTTYQEFINENGQLLKDRLNALADTLMYLRRRGRI